MRRAEGEIRTLDVNLGKVAAPPRGSPVAPGACAPSFEAPDSIVTEANLALTLRARRTPLLGRLSRHTAQAECCTIRGTGAFASPGRTRTASARKLLGAERLVPSILNSGSESVQQVCDRILQAVLEWSPVPEDDVTVLVARHRAKPTATLG